ncbi:hypothetical protein ACWT_1814 [Actinoplanes sp. SE50]|uniref:hypothetical protein n=1 Tax=unclassified Actinoplanes TaxID=2626549 RepID=UPI00023ED593|nr:MULTISPECIES: hypothetical protein [unclassified Actinoplanes]AEV82833.1 hypothetical protein ACPL_1936 [Actinoplanes sp. SE50/110]ATO81229.1 hypothetical protein ACWT_1814 [Actinoplanes sp. SE50]SLL98636.1 hypothetical protein ACSP50_1863 [Actinoplanes sp. SE50/110]
MTFSRTEGHAFTVWVEPEGDCVELPQAQRAVFSFRGPDGMDAQLTHHPDRLVIWRPPDTEVWLSVDGDEFHQVAGFADIPAPGLDSSGAGLSVPIRDIVEDLFH